MLMFTIAAVAVTALANPGDGVPVPVPTLEDRGLEMRLKGPDVFGYDDRTIPKAHQDWEGGLQGIHDSRHNNSAEPREPFGNGNMEFPWAKPAGTDNARNVQAVRFVLLPKKEGGKKWPVVYYRQQPYSVGPVNVQHNSGLAWMYPAGTVVGEVLTIQGPDGKARPFEVRTRTRHKERWSMNAFRPFPTAKDLVSAVKRLRPKWKDDRRLAEFVQGVEDGRYAEPAPVRIADTAHPTKLSFDRTAKQEQLPELPKELVDELLAQPFKAALGESWRDGEHAPAAPTTQANYHIVPAGYFAGHIAVDSESCMDCHKSTNKHVMDFDFSRDWYGRIRGSDGILSLHPFDPSVISARGSGGPMLVNQRLLDAGVFAAYDPAQHPEDRYKRIPGLD